MKALTILSPFDSENVVQFLLGHQMMKGCRRLQEMRADSVPKVIGSNTFSMALFIRTYRSQGTGDGAEEAKAGECQPAHASSVGKPESMGK